MRDLILILIESMCPGPGNKGISTVGGNKEMRDLIHAKLCEIRLSCHEVPLSCTRDPDMPNC